MQYSNGKIQDLTIQLSFAKITITSAW